MARSQLAVPVHKYANSTDAASSFTSSAQTQAAVGNQYAFVVLGAFHATADPVKPTISNSGTSFTWIEVADHIYSTGANPRLRMTVYYADISAGFTSITFTAASTGARAVSMDISIWTDVDISFLSNFAFADNPTGDPTITLGALSDSSTSAVYTAYAGWTGSGVISTVPTGYTSLNVVSIGVASGTYGHFYDVSSPSTTLSYVSSGSYSIGFALELRSLDHKFGFSAAGTAGNSKTGTTASIIIPTAVPAGSLFVVAVGSDNTGTTDASGQDDIVSVTDSVGNTYTFAAGYRNGNAAAQAGAHASIWYSVLNNTLPINASVILTNTTSAYARSVGSAIYTISTGVLSVAGSAGAAGDAGVDPSAIISGLASDEYLWVGAAADETTAVPATAAGFTATSSNATSGGGTAVNMAVRQFYAVETGTTKTFTPATAADAAAVLVAFKLATGPTGNLVATETGSDTTAVTATVPVAGSLAQSETGPDTSAITATVPIAGTFAVTEATVDTVAVNGVVVPTQGSLGVAETGADVAALAGTLGSLPITGSFDVQETGSDTAAISSVAVVAGSFNSTEIGPDTASFPGVTVTVAGTFATTETGPDVAAINARVLVAGTFAVTEANVDVVTADVRAIVTATLALVETGPDTASLTGAIPVAGSFAVTETGPDTASINVAAKVAGSFAVTETGPDTAVITSTVTVSGSVSIVEIGSDSAIFNAGSEAILQVSVAATETGSDVAAFTGALGALLITGSLGSTESGPDTTIINGAVSVAGTLNASEAGADIADIAGGHEGEITGNVAAQEIGSDVASFTGTVEVIVEAERDRLGTSVTRFEERRHKPRKRAPLAGKPLTDKQIRQLQAKVHEKRQAIWKKPEPAAVEGPVVVEPPPPSQTPAELEKARTAVSIAKVQLEYETLRKQREAELAVQQAIIERQQEAERLRREAIESELAAKEAEQERVRLEVLRKQDAERQEKAARVQEMLAVEERKLKEAEQERARVEKQNAEIARIKKTSETIAHFQKLLAEQQQRIKEVEEERIRVEALHRQNQEVMAVLLS